MKSLRISLIYGLLILLSSTNLDAQTTYPDNGVADIRPSSYQLTNATVYVTPDRKIENATLSIKKGKVVSVSPGGAADASAISIDMKGKFIYPSFIDIYSSYGVKKPEKKKNEPGPQFISDKKGAYSWNQAIKP